MHLNLIKMVEKTAPLLLFLANHEFQVIVVALVQLFPSFFVLCTPSLILVDDSPKVVI